MASIWIHGVGQGQFSEARRLGLIEAPKNKETTFFRKPFSEARRLGLIEADDIASRLEDYGVFSEARRLGLIEARHSADLSGRS